MKPGDSEGVAGKAGGAKNGAVYTIFLVPSASHATKGEAALLRAGVACALIPVPRVLSSQCGVCLRVALDARAAAAEVLDAAGVRTDAIHDLAAQRPDPRLHDQRGDHR